MGKYTKAELLEMTEWPANEQVGTSGHYSEWSGKRVGSRYHYLKDWPECRLVKGFRTRPTFEEWMDKHGTERQKLAGAIDFRASMGLR